MQTLPQFVELRTEKCSIIIDCRRNTPVIMYFAEALKQHSQPDMLALLSTRQEAKCAVVEEVPLSLSPCLGDGFTGHPGISLHNDGIAWSVSAKLVEVSQANAQQVTFTSLDSTRNIQLQHELVLDAQSHVLCASTKVTNLATAPLVVNDCAAPTIAISDNLTKITSFEGRWSNEFQRQPIDLFLGAFVRENRKGKTSHDNFPGVLLHEPTATEYQGECMGFHLGWSGNHRTRVELLPEQRTYVQMAELLGSQEVVLKQHDSYTSPILYVSFSATGFTQLSQQFHRFVRSNMLSEQVRQAPRMVHYNTWEGIYFNHETNTLKTLADIVANVGAERFVLDDGWFKGRRGDKAGLGDWLVDSAIYPQGLSPLISHVKDLGMAFGIWFEPEMVNPDSDLYRAHPDWILQTQNNQQLRFRNQYVLDLTSMEEVY
jgi:alpha-galactosidase